MNSEIKGIVIKSKPFGNNDLLLTLFSDTEGKITILAKGVRGTKRSVLYTQPFAFSDFILYRGNSLYVVDQASVKESFYSLREDICTLSAAQYLLELTDQLPKEMVLGDEGELLRLLLNSLYLLSKRPGDLPLLSKVKMMFELRFAAGCGFRPDLTSCTICGSTTPGYWFFGEGMKCPDCGADQIGGHRITVSMQKAVEHVLNAPMADAYRFDMDPDAFSYLAELVEHYIRTVFNTDFSALIYLKKLINGFKIENI